MPRYYPPILYTHLLLLNEKLSQYVLGRVPLESPCMKEHLTTTCNLWEGESYLGCCSCTQVMKRMLTDTSNVESHAVPTPTFERVTQQRNVILGCMRQVLLVSNVSQCKQISLRFACPSIKDVSRLMNASENECLLFTWLVMCQHRVQLCCMTNKAS